MKKKKNRRGKKYLPSDKIQNESMDDKNFFLWLISPLVDSVEEEFNNLGDFLSTNI